jgi:NAD(P)-dependent dehydrogenase (short-subunit alcohol dehydrogenase family)
MIDSPDISVFDAKVETLRKTMETNVYGPLQLIQALVPLMKEHDYGRIVNVSSGMGQLTDMGGGYPGYRLSKTSLNALTRIFANELNGTHILINTMCPGWVKTDMGGPGATRTPEQGVDTMVWLATLPNDGPTGAFFRDRKPIPW